MLIEVDPIFYKNKFTVDPHPFISEAFINLNQNKVDKIVRLIEDNTKGGIGIVAGIKNEVIESPFSAPFGGFHFHHHYHYSSDIDNFIFQLIEYSKNNNIQKIKITLPPDIYHQNFNAKMVNSLIRSGFNQKLPDITNWVDLKSFNNSFSQRDSRNYLKQAVKNQLSFSLVFDESEKQNVYDLIYKNRSMFGRPIYMTFQDIINTSQLWPVDFFRVIDKEGNIVASAIFYRAHPFISYAVFWGDNEAGRPLRAMDFLSFNLWEYYKSSGYNYIDLGTSTESGIPNNGLLRFKETHDCKSSLKYTFVVELNSIPDN